MPDYAGIDVKSLAQTLNTCAFLSKVRKINKLRKSDPSSKVRKVGTAKSWRKLKSFSKKMFVGDRQVPGSNMIHEIGNLLNSY